jgi:outer membrane protein assembly factor BamB
LETANGEELWRISLTELGGSIPTWGYTESVLVDGDSVVCTPGGPAGAVVAVHRRTGHVLWRSTDFTEDAQYTSIVPIDHNGQRQYVQLTQKSLVGLDAQTGRIAWRTDWLGNVAVVPTPIVHQGYVYATAGYGAGCILFQLGDGSSVTSVYDDQAKKAMKNHHGGVLLFEDHIYGYSDGVGWVCQEFLSGKIVWRERSKFGKGSIGFADGMLYLLSEDDGTVVLIDASPHGWNEKGRFTLQPQSKIRKREGRIWVHPVVCNGRLFLRDQDLVYCYDVSAK